MANSEKQIAELLLQIKAIKINVAKPFQWASGWKSPIYCDNRKTLSYPKIRNIIRKHFINLINEKFENVEAIAGIATGAIAHSAFIADSLDLPLLYVRSTQKNHGLQNLIEGEIIPNQRIVIVEDLVSTGGSSLKAASALSNSNFNILGMTAIFSYEFESTVKRFNEAKCKLYTLCGLKVLVESAIESGYIKPEELKLIELWHENPGNWGAKNNTD